MQDLKRWSLASLAVFFLFATLSLPEVSAKNFSDVSKSNSHYKSIMSLTEQGVLHGYENGEFGVWDNLTRQQAAHVVVGAGKLRKATKPNEVLQSYSDITETNPGREDIATVIQANILKGSNGQFRPYVSMTREQVATVLVRAMNLDKIKANRVVVNLKNVSPDHRANVQTIANMGISVSYKDFQPAEPVTRGAFATMIDRAQQVKNRNASLLPQTAPTNQAVTGSREIFEKKVVQLTNKERTSRGLKALKTDATLNKTAFLKSEDMYKKDYFDHVSPTYGTPFDLMKKHGVVYKAAGENIALGYKNPEDVVNAWMKSKGHKENILNKEYTHIGVGYEARGNYWTQHFIGK